MTFYLMADSELEEFRALESRAMLVEASAITAAAGSPEPITYEGDIPVIHVSGMLTPERIGFLDFFGKAQTVYGDITDQLGQVVAMGKTEAIIEADSGGGNVDGMFEAMDDIATSPLKITGRVVGQAQSAMYMLLSQTDVIESTKEYNFVGSIGVKTGVSGAKEISNSESPHKVVGAKTDDGKYAAQQTLDEIYGMILPRMAAGRNTTVERINADWGKGATMTAKTALARGMIDIISEPKKAGRSGITKDKAMNREQLRAEHPDLYASVFAEGEEAGRSAFKKLAGAHAKAAETSKDYARAMSDIAAGNELDSEGMFHHLAAAKRDGMMEDRGDEAPPTLGEGKDPQADAHADAKDDDNILVADAKAFWGGKVNYV